MDAVSNKVLIIKKRNSGVENMIFV